MEAPKMFKYLDIAFRPMEERDIELIREQHNEESTLLMLGDPTLVSPIQQKRWWEAMSQSRTNIQYCICHDNKNTVIGVWRFQNYDSINRNCEVGVDIFPEYRRKGFGEKAYRMILKYLFEHYNMHTIYLKTAEFNQAGISLYTKIGFEQTGRLKETIFRYGRYWDNLLMCITSDLYFKIGKYSKNSQER